MSKKEICSRISLSSIAVHVEASCGTASVVERYLLGWDRTLLPSDLLKRHMFSLHRVLESSEFGFLTASCCRMLPTVTSSAARNVFMYGTIAILLKFPGAVNRCLADNNSFASGIDVDDLCFALRFTKQPRRNRPCLLAQFSDALLEKRNLLAWRCGTDPTGILVPLTPAKKQNPSNAFTKLFWALSPQVRDTNFAVCGSIPAWSSGTKLFRCALYFFLMIAVAEGLNLIVTTGVCD